MYKNKTILAFIPAKTNSQGLPGKMFRKIGNYSLFDWTLYAAYKSVFIDEIIVSSNDGSIEDQIKIFETHATKDLCLAHKKIQFIRRPSELCTAKSKTEEAMSQFLNEFLIYRNFDYLMLLQATSPIRQNNLIDKCVENCIDDYDSLITVSKHTPFFWRKNNETQSVYPTYSLKNRPMRQDISDEDFYYHDNGNIYITKMTKYFENKIRVSGKVFLHETNVFESMQIDTPEDFDLMSAVYEKIGSFV